MNLVELWPALGAALVAGVAMRQTPRKHLVGYVMSAFFVVAAAIWLWPDPTVSTKPGEEWPHLLNLLIGLPLGGAVALMFIPRQLLSVVRGFTYLIFGLSFLASLYLLSVPMTAGWHFQYVQPWIESAGIRWHVATDGISVWLIVLTTFTTPIAAFASFGSVKTRIKELCIAFLVLQGAMIGAFVALDMFLFYVFWELMLVPMFLMIGIWGGADKIKAAVKFFIYTMTGSVLMLAAIVYLAWNHFELTGMWSFDYLALSRVLLPGIPGAWGPQMACFAAFSLAFFIKVPMFPVHTWLPDAHVQAPTGGSVLLAAVMLKLGTYGYLRFSMGLFPAQALAFAPPLAGVAIMGGILYGALCAWKQDDIKKLVAYSSVAHLGFVMLGLFGASQTGMTGAVMVMINHGIATGALFLLVGVLYDRRHTREVKEFGGIAKVMPIYATLFIIVTMASIGVPGTNGFVGEFMVITGTYVARRLNQFAGLQSIAAAFGVILAAVYMLSMVKKVFFGPLDNPKNQKLTDITPREGLALAPLIGLIFIVGFFPRLFTTRIAGAVNEVQQRLESTAGYALQHVNTKAAQLIPEDQFAKAFLSGAPKKDAEDKEKVVAEAGGSK